MKIPTTLQHKPVIISDNYEFIENNNYSVGLSYDQIITALVAIFYRLQYGITNPI